MTNWNTSTSLSAASRLSLHIIGRLPCRGHRHRHITTYILSHVQPLLHRQPSSSATHPVAPPSYLAGLYFTKHRHVPKNSVNRRAPCFRSIEQDLSVGFHSVDTSVGPETGTVQASPSPAIPFWNVLLAWWVPSSVRPFWPTWICCIFSGICYEVSPPVSCPLAAC